MRFVIALLLLFSFIPAHAEKPDPEKKEFMDLVQSRNVLFEKYTASLSQKSGFFGNRTKNDIKDSQDKLMQIVQLDNKIMSMLNQRLGFRNFEKQSMTDDLLTVQQKLINLNIVNDTLTKKLSVCEIENSVNKKILNKHKFYFFFLILALCAGIFLWYKGRRRN